jgi:hypothetical protein
MFWDPSESSCYLAGSRSPVSESSEARMMGWIESDEGWVLPLLRGEEFGEADKKGGWKD